jgi:hypothetical protein
LTSASTTGDAGLPRAASYFASKLATIASIKLLACGRTSLDKQVVPTVSDHYSECESLEVIRKKVATERNTLQRKLDAPTVTRRSPRFRDVYDLLVRNHRESRVVIHFNVSFPDGMTPGDCLNLRCGLLSVHGGLSREIRGGLVDLQQSRCDNMIQYVYDSAKHAT